MTIIVKSKKAKMSNKADNKHLHKKGKTSKLSSKNIHLHNSKRNVGKLSLKDNGKRSVKNMFTFMSGGSSSGVPKGVSSGSLKGVGSSSSDSSGRTPGKRYIQNTVNPNKFVPLFSNNFYSNLRNPSEKRIITFKDPSSVRPMLSAHVLKSPSHPGYLYVNPNLSGNTDSRTGSRRSGNRPIEKLSTTPPEISRANKPSNVNIYNQAHPEAVQRQKTLISSYLKPDPSAPATYDAAAAAAQKIINANQGYFDPKPYPSVGQNAAYLDISKNPPSASSVYQIANPRANRPPDYGQGVFFDPTYIELREGGLPSNYLIIDSTPKSSEIAASIRAAPSTSPYGSSPSQFVMPAKQYLPKSLVGQYEFENVPVAPVYGEAQKLVETENTYAQLPIFSKKSAIQKEKEAANAEANAELKLKAAEETRLATQKAAENALKLKAAQPTVPDITKALTEISGLKKSSTKEFDKFLAEIESKKQIVNKIETFSKPYNKSNNNTAPPGVKKFYETFRTFLKENTYLDDLKQKGTDIFKDTPLENASYSQLDQIIKEFLKKKLSK